MFNKSAVKMELHGIKRLKITSYIMSVLFVDGCAGVISYDIKYFFTNIFEVNVIELNVNKLYKNSIKTYLRK